MIGSIILMKKFNEMKNDCVACAVPSIALALLCTYISKIATFIIQEPRPFHPPGDLGRGRGRGALQPRPRRRPRRLRRRQPQVRGQVGDAGGGRRPRHGQPVFPDAGEVRGNGNADLVYTGG